MVVKLDEAAWEKWQSWIHRIKDDLGAIVADGDDFRFFRDTINANAQWIDAHSGTWFVNFVVRSYISRVALGLRRQVDEDKDVISLARLAEQMATCAPQLTMEFYRARFPQTGNELPWHHSAFRHVSEDGRTASADKIRARIQHLRQVLANIWQYTDNVIAHANKNQVKIAFTFGDLDAALTEFERMAIDFMVLLTGNGYSTFIPVKQFNASAVFEHPFIAPVLEPSDAKEKYPGELTGRVQIDIRVEDRLVAAVRGEVPDVAQDGGPNDSDLILRTRDALLARGATDVVTLRRPERI